MSIERKIYLIRHGEPDVPTYGKFFYSATDYKLSTDGETEARQTASWLKSQLVSGATIISSPLARCRRTAELIAEAMGVSADRVIIDERIKEISCGDWEGMTFAEVKEKYPEEFEQRGRDLAGYRIPGGENFLDAGERFGAAFDDLAERYDGNLVIVAHAGVFRGFLLRFEIVDENNLFDIPMPYAGITIMKDEGPELIGWKPTSFLDDNQVERMYRRQDVPAHIIKHMKAVADYQDELLNALEEHGIFFNREVLRKAALLHDIKRLLPKHAREGALYLRGQGYQEVADIVANHHSPYSPEDRGAGMLADRDYTGCPICASDIMFYADKRVQEDQLVSVEARFARSRGKCTTAESLERHTAVFNRAKRIENEIDKILKG